MKRQKSDDKRKKLGNCGKGYEYIFNHIADAIVVADRLGNIVDVNQSAVALFGYSREKFLTMKIEDLHPRKNVSSVRRAFKDMLEKSQNKIINISIIDKNKRVKDVELRARKITIEKKSCLIGVFRDVTEYNKVKNIKEESELNLRGIFDDAPVPMAISSIKDGVYKDVNKKFTEVLGFSEKEVVGKSSLDLGIFVDFRERREAINLFKKRGKLDGFEVRARRKDGKVLTMLFSISSIMLAGKKYLLTQALDITKHKENELALKEGREKLANIIRNSPGMIYLANPDWSAEIVTGSKEVCGYSPKDFASKKVQWLDLIHKKDKKKVFEVGSRLTKKPLSVSQVYRIIDSKGKTRWVNDRKVSIFEKRKFKIIYGLVHDITKERLIEEQYENFLRLTPRGVHVYELIGGELIFIEGNQSADKILGIKHKSLVGKKITNAFPGLVKTKIPAIYKEVAKSGKVWQGEVPYDKGGINGFFDVAAFKLTENKIAASFADTTERHKLLDELVASEKKFSSVVENSNDGIVVLQKNAIKYSNPALENMLGYSKKEVIGRQMIDFIDPRFKKLVADYALKREHGLPAPSRYEFAIVSKGGVSIPVEANISVVGYNGDRATIAIIRDITRAKEVDRIKTEFISLASHQLRTPLTGIKWVGQLLLNGRAGNLNSKQLDFLNQMVESDERVISLVNDLLDVSHIEAGEKFSINKKKASLTAAIKGVVNQHKAELNKRAMSVKLDLGGYDQLLFSFDPVKVGQIIGNLLSNSIKYSGKSKNIIIGAKRNGDEIVTYVKDFGVGIPEEEQSKVFTRFFRGYNISTLATEGTGLGLYIAKGIVEAHGGRIWFESRENKGSTFYFSLPIKK